MATATKTKADPKPATKRTTTTRSATAKSGTPFTVIAGAATASVAVGMLAFLGRKAAVQAPAALIGDWMEGLKAEHVATMKVFDLLQATDNNATARRTLLLGHLKHALSKHALEEENVVYPALRDAGEREGADELTTEQAYVKQWLYELANIPKNSPQFLARLGEFRVDIEKHIREEEDELFPKLHARLSEEQNRALTVAMNREGFKLA